MVLALRNFVVPTSVLTITTDMTGETVCLYLLLSPSLAQNTQGQRMSPDCGGHENALEGCANEAAVL
jgi:hypothetical protein